MNYKLPDDPADQVFFGIAALGAVAAVGLLGFAAWKSMGPKPAMVGALHAGETTHEVRDAANKAGCAANALRLFHVDGTMQAAAEAADGLERLVEATREIVDTDAAGERAAIQAAQLRTVAGQRPLSRHVPMTKSEVVSKSVEWANDWDRWGYALMQRTWG